MIKNSTRLIVVSTTMLAMCACETNQFDVSVATQEANKIKYEEQAYRDSVNEANKARPLFVMQGQLLCDQEQISSNNCGITVNNPFQKVIIPERKKGFADGVEAVGDTIVGIASVLTPILLAREVVNLADSIGDSAGGNVNNENSGNTTPTTTTTTTTTDNSKTAGTSLTDGASSIDNSIQDSSKNAGTELADGSAVIDKSVSEVATTSTVDSNDANITDSYNPQTPTDSNDVVTTTTVLPEPVVAP